MSGREQRFKVAAPYAGFQLEYSKIKAADRTLLDNFVASTKGSFDSTWQFTMLGTTYGNLGFETDDFSWEESTPGLYNASLRFRQTISSGAAAAGTGTSYPTFAGGITTQLPFVQSTRYLTARNDLECGIRHAYAFYGAGLTGYPTRGINAPWTLTYPVFTDAEVATLEGFFALHNGRVGTFSFTDPKDAAVYSKVRFDNDSLDFKYLSPNITSVTVKLVEVP